MDLRILKAALAIMIGVGTTWPVAGKSAPVTFDMKALPAILHTDFFIDEHVDPKFNKPVHFVIEQRPENDDDIRNGIEFRIFSLFPSDTEIRNGTVSQVEPQAWPTKNPAVDCLVYLSLVYRPDRAMKDYMLDNHEFDLGPLAGAAGWLPMVDQNNIGHGYYLLVVEKVTPIDPPSIPDYGNLDMRYEFIRLDPGMAGKYFRAGIAFRTIRATGR